MKARHKAKKVKQEKYPEKNIVFGFPRENLREMEAEAQKAAAEKAAAEKAAAEKAAAEKAAEEKAAAEKQAETGKVAGPSIETLKKYKKLRNEMHILNMYMKAEAEKNPELSERYKQLEKKNFQQHQYMFFLDLFLIILVL